MFQIIVKYGPNLSISFESRVLYWPFLVHNLARQLFALPRSKYRFIRLQALLQFDHPAFQVHICAVSPRDEDK